MCILGFGGASDGRRHVEVRFSQRLVSNMTNWDSIRSKQKSVSWYTKHEKIKLDIHAVGKYQHVMFCILHCQSIIIIAITIIRNRSWIACMFNIVLPLLIGSRPKDGDPHETC